MWRSRRSNWEVKVSNGASDEVSREGADVTQHDGFTDCAGHRDTCRPGEIGDEAGIWPSVEGLLVLLDLGSAAMSAEMALETLGKPFILSNAPLVEGAVMAAVQASIGADLDQVATAALQAKDLDKLQR